MTTIYDSLSHLNGNPIAAIDFETTGGTSGHHEIIQIGVILLNANLDPYPDVRPFYHNIAPVYPERAEHQASVVHGLDLADLMLNAPSSEKVSDLFLEWFEALRLPQGKRLTPLAHNWVFEWGFSNAWLGPDMHEHIFHFHPRDGMLLATSIRDRAAFAGTRIPFKYVGLKSLCKRFGIVNEKPHDALCDAKAEAAVYRALLQHEMT